MKVKVVKDHFCGTGWRAEPETLYLGGVGAVYVEKLEFELPEEWDGLAVTLHIEQEGGAVPQPMLLDGNNNAPVDRRFTTARQGLWMLMATDGEGRREMTMPGKYVCYQTLENGEGTGADGPAMPLRYQYLQLVLEQEARAALEAQRAARYRQWVADRCAAKEHALLLEALSGMRYSDASAWDMIAQLKQRWNSPPPEQAEPVAVESIRLDSKELSIKVGESCPLKATVLPGSAPQTVEWMAEPEGIVQLRENTLTAVKGGTVLLTAIAGGKLAQRRVRSVAVLLEKLALDKPSVKLKQGESVTLTATLTPTQSTVTAVSWTTNNAALAVMKDQTTAVENGKAVNTLAAMKDGSCIITAAAGGKSAVCSVTVEKNGQSGGDEPAIVMYAVSNRLNGLSTSRADVVVQSGKAYTAALTLNEGYWLISIKVTMGGEDVTATAWNEKKMTVSIPDVTGNIVITAEAKLPMLKELAVGAVTKLVEKDGAAAEEFMVIAQDYEKELNGEGRTLLARRHGITGKKWNTTWCTYADSLIDVYLNSEYLKDAPQALKDILTETKFYYTPGYSGSGSSYTGSHTVTTLSRKVFLPSCYEFGFESYGYTSASSPKYYHLEGSTFADAKKLALALLAADAETAGSVPNTYFHFCLWTRTPVLNDYGSGLTGSALKEYLYKCAEAVWAQMLTAPDKLNWGGYKVNEPENMSWPDLYRCWTHPCFTLPGNTVIDAKGNIVEVREE